jgi:hypothetical protein
LELIPGYEELNPYFGDLHNHCAVGYGHGSAEDAFNNARLQLDFAAVTPHAHWPDMPLDESRLDRTVEYHRAGFQRTQEEWERFREVVERFNRPGRFATFLGFEWHSMAYGDHHVIYNGSQGEILRPDSLEEMRGALRRQAERGIEGFVIPHHIGYKRGYRGINWAAFDSSFSPVVEIMSMHGASESDQGPYPFLHTMGPRDWESTFQYGLTEGHIAGAVGSTDHHSAHPGSYGHGRLGAWGRSLTRDAIWEAIRSRRTCALTGDCIRLAFSVNGQPMGSVLPADPERQIEIAVEGGDAIDEIVLFYNNTPLQIWKGKTRPREVSGAALDRYKIHFEVGWGERNQDVDWEVTLQVIDGELVSVEPRFRGREVVEPQAEEQASYHFSRWERAGEAGMWFNTRTWGNPTTTTSSTQGASLEVLGLPQSRIRAVVNGQASERSLGDLIEGARAGYLGRFLTPAYYFHRAVPSQEFLQSVSADHKAGRSARDWYYVRVRQKNNQYAWSSPVWIEGSGSP